MRAVPATALLLSAAIALSGCVSLFPKAKPAQLYRFGGAVSTEAAASAVPGARMGVALAPVAFSQAASGDRILTYNGSEAAYVAGARWVEPAQVMFASALERRFEQEARVTRLIDRRQATASSLSLTVDVDAFETRYNGGPKAAPTVVVSFSARLVKYPERTVVAERRFTATQAAADNRLAAIVPAYDAAVADALGQLVAWTDQNVGGR